MIGLKQGTVKLYDHEKEWEEVAKAVHFQEQYYENEIEIPICC